MTEDGSATASCCSSTASSKATEASQTQAMFFTTRMPLIPFLMKLEMQYPRRLVVLGLLAETSQVLGFALNPHNSYSGAVKPLSLAVYSSHLPFWDNEHADIGFYPSLAVFWVFTALLGLYLGWILSTSSRIQTGWTVAAKQVFCHSLSGWLYIPITSWLLHFGFCNADDEFWSTGESCTGIRLVFKICAWFAALLLFCFAFVVNTSLFDSMYCSSHILARAHSHCDKVNMIYRFVTIVLYHTFESAGKSRWFTLYHMLMCVFVSICYAFLMPYYKQGVTQFKATSFLLGAWMSLVPLLSETGGFYADLYMDLVILCVGVLPVIFIASVLSECRISRTFVAYKAHLLAGRTSDTPIIWPKGIAQSTENEAHSLEQPKQINTEAINYNFTVSLIDRVIFETDCELATRFVADIRKCTNNNEPLPREAIDFCTKILSRGFIIFKKSGIIPLQLAYFTCCYCSGSMKNYALHNHLDQCIAKIETSLAIRYHATKLTGILKKGIGMKDNSHVKVWRAAQKLHREVLSQMGTFWTKLQCNQVDTVQLAVITKAITKKREQADEEFKRVLHLTQDDSVVLSYALFLDQVMHDEAAATALRDQTERGIETSRAAKAGEGKQDNSLGATGGKDPLIKVRCAFAALSIVLSAFVVGLFTFQSLTIDHQKRLIDGIEAAGSTRALATHASSYAMLLCSKDPWCKTEVFHNTDGDILAMPSSLPARIIDEPVQRALGRTLNDLLSSHEYLTAGNGWSSYKRLSTYYEKSTSFLKISFPKKAGAGEVAGSRQPISLWNVGFEVVSVLKSLLVDISPPVTESARILTFKWVIDNVQPVSEMMNHSLTLRQEQLTHELETTVVYSTIMFVSCILIIVLIFGVMIINFNDIEQKRLGALNLFTLIPREELVDLLKKTRAKLQVLDHSNEENSNNVNTKQEVELAEDDDSTTEGETEGATVNPGIGDELEDDYMMDDDQEFHVGLPTKTFMSISFVLAICLVIVTFVLTITYDSVEVRYSKSRKNLAIISDVEDFVHNRKHYFREAIQSGETYVHIRFLDYAFNNFFKDKKRKLLEGGIPISAMFLFEELMVLDSRTLRIQLIAIKLAAAIYNVKSSVSGSIDTVTWNAGESIESVLDFFPLSLNSTYSDMHLPDTEKKKLISEIVKNHDLENELEHTFVKIIDNMHDETDKETKADSLSYTTICMIVSAALLLTLTFLLVSGLRDPVIFSATHLRFVFGITYISVIAHLIIILTTAVDITDTNALSKLEAGGDVRAIQVSFRKTIEKTYEFVTIGLHDYAYVFGYIREANFDVELGKIEEEEGFREIAASLKEEVQKTVHVCQIAATLKQWSLGQPSTVWAVDSLLRDFDINWDIEEEPESIALREQYADSSWYSNTADDSLLPTERQGDIARGLIISQLFTLRTATVTKHFVDLLKMKSKKLSDEVQNMREMSRNKVQLVIYGAAFICLSYMTFVFLFFTLSLEVSKRYTTGTALDSDTGHTIKSKICLSVIALLLSGTYVVQYLSATATLEQTEHLKDASAREWSVANAQVRATVLAYGERGLEQFHKDELKVALDEIDHIRGILYYGEDRSDGAITPIADPDMLFSRNSSYENRACLNQQVGSSFLLSGIDSALHNWVATARDMLHLSGSGALQQQFNVLTLYTDPVLFGLMESTAKYHSDAKDVADEWRNWFTLLICLTAIVLLGQIVFVFRSIITDFVRQESGTKVMIKMVPPEVREKVPAIQEFLDLGLVQAGDIMNSINEAVNEMQTTPIVAIDHLGTVIKFTQAGEAVWGWQQSEVIGNNIMMLMPQDYAQQHNRFLSDYLRTGIKKVVGKVRNVYGLRRDGTEFPLKLSIREFKTPGEPPTFISPILDRTRQIELEATTRLNKATQQMSPVPLVCIDTLASITSFNKAAEQCFGWSADEILNQNVSVLMPEEIGKHHDGYIAAYLKTRVKKVIDKILKIKGLKKNGSLFQMELCVKEIKLQEGMSTSSFFLAFTHDITENIETEHAQSIQQTISDNHPYPNICINQTGHVILFSKAACSLFHYEPDEVIGQNIKFIIPPDIAVHHDSYLEQYLVTGQRKVIGTTSQLKGVRKNGTVLELDVNVRELSGVDDEERMYTAFIMDLTDHFDMLAKQTMLAVSIELSPVPVITITSDCIVTLYNKPAEGAFKLEPKDVIGLNVKKLLPPDIAIKHDEFIATYLSTKKSHIIGKTIVNQAKKGTGTLFPIRLRVDELVGKDGEIIFMAYLTDISNEITLLRSALTNDAFANICPVAVVTMDGNGVLKTLNRAALEAWGYESAQVIGNNVKVLMPERVAANHDGYLEAYKRTGIKHVIGSTRFSTAITSSGDEFPIEISVAEFHFLQGRLFAANINDLTERSRKMSILEISNAIFEISPTPVLIVSPMGILDSFSNSLCDLTGYSATELRGQNIKMLMPEKIAFWHDEFLSSFRRTGVRTFLGKKNVVKLVTKSKEEITIEVFADEVEYNDTLIGFIKDVRDVVKMQEENALADVLLNACESALVAIDEKGTIVRFSSVSTRLFGWGSDEILGQNVTTLMTEKDSDNHPYYLKQYKKLREKRVIGTKTRVKGKTRTGAELDLELTIKELTIGDKYLFMGFLRDISQELLNQRSKSLCEAIIEMSSLAFIGITGTGIIQQFNPAAVQLFKRPMDEVVGTNIKILMPEEISSQHDGYLSEYQRTGIKHVVDTTREVMCLPRGGEPEPIQIKVRETKLMGESFFFGFVTAIKGKLEQRLQERINKAAIEVTTPPVIVIDEVGTISLFQDNANVLGYAGDDVISQNVRMFLPDEIAYEHDGYLLQYQRTRVKNVLKGKRVLIAKHKNGTLIPVEASIREVILSESKIFFVGNLTCVEQQMQIQNAVDTSQAIISMCPVAVITISEMGSVLLVNKIAEQLLEIESSEVLNTNIKAYLPPEIEREHDRYLKRYRDTRLKRIMGSSRQLTGWRNKQKIPFPLSIHISETSSDGELEFTAFISDLSGEAVIQEAVEFNNFVIQTCPTAFISLNHQALIIRFSAAATKLFGFSEREVKGNNVKMLMPPEVAAKHDGFIERYLETGIKKAIDSSLRVCGRTKNGDPVWGDLLVRESKIIPGDPPTFLGYFRDLTEEIAMYNDKLIVDLTVKTVTIPIIAMQPDCEVTLFNQAAVSTFGYEANTVIGKNINMLMPESVAVNHDGYIQRYLADGIKRVVGTTRNVMAVSKSGVLIPVKLQIFEFQSELSHLFIGFVEDQSEVRQLSINSQIGDVILELSPTPLITINEKGIVLKFNGAAESRFSFSAEHVVGKNIRILMPDEISERHDSYIERFINSENRSASKVVDNTSGVVVTCETKNGDTFKANLRVGHIEDLTGHIFIGTLTML